MHKKNFLLLLILLLTPSIVLASGSAFTAREAIFIELFTTIHMSIFVLYPISNLLSSEKPSKLFWKLFIIRACILLIGNTISPSIAFVDFILIFIGAFLVVPILGAILHKNPYKRNTVNITTTGTRSFTKTGVLLKCASCNTDLDVEDKFCPNCGMAIEGDNIVVVDNSKDVVAPNNFDPMFDLPEEQMIDSYILSQMNNLKIDVNEKKIPISALKRKNIMFIILAVLMFAFLSMIFFHLSLVFYFIGLIILFVFYKQTKKYSLLKFIKKEVKARPEEDIDKIILSVSSTFTEDTSKRVFILSTVISIILPFIIFFNPHILYETNKDGAVVRFYTVGITNFTKVTIPDTHKGLKVIGIRGQVFKNMYFLKSVKLPDSIEEIRGQAFENDSSLESINIPTSLTYLGGSSFKGCKSLKEVTLPDTLEFIGGEAFKDAVSLESINIPESVTEIRGNTFENDKSLKSINIPDSITRIGGHAFYGCSSLSEVKINETSKLKEIGSSAFRKCSGLSEVTIPSITSVNSRAFKESPTKVKKFGEVDYGSLINREYFKNTSFEYLRVGETEKISKYIDSVAKEIDAEITLKSINVTANGNEFILQYKDKNKTKEFKLNKDNSLFKANDDIAIEVSASYVFSSSSSISLNTYYN